MQEASARTLSQSSPLDSFVRRTSRKANLTPLLTPSRAAAQAAPQPVEHSPILHTNFRTSSTTFDSYSQHDRSGSDAQSSYSWANHDSMSHDPRVSGQGLLSTSFAEARAGLSRGESMIDSVYSESTYDIDEITAQYRDSQYRDSWRSDGTARPGESPAAASIPTVVVSTEPGPHNAGGELPSQLQGNGQVNFSRPSPPPVDRSDERKLEVLRRNQQRSSRSSSAASRQSTRSPLGQHELQMNASRSDSSMGANSPRSPSAGAASPQVSRVSPNLSPSAPPSAVGSPQGSPRPTTPVSLYSNYSYYNLENLAPTPTTPGHPPTSPSPSPSPSLSPRPTTASPAPKESKTPEEYLQLGIAHHEANRLTESAACFQKSATLNGGCGVGMLMWGLTQRHGWGCTQNEQAGFRWLRRAAEVAVEDLEHARRGVNTGAVKKELVLAIYEVGQSFFQGWGVEKDKEMAVSYYRVAARLGDPDAQQDLAFCLANGKGCKKDKKEAAKWYRAAVAQGASDVGLAWIYKEKYQ